MDMRFNGEDPIERETGLRGYNQPPRRDDDIALDIAELRDHLNKAVEINRRIAAKAPQVGKSLREYTNILMRITERWK